jgi:hypothetical protein
MSFTCSICGEASTQICVRCTKDACPNHLCDKCRRCSDCCECEVALNDREPAFTPVSRAIHPPKPDPAPEPPQPPPDPDPFPEPPDEGTGVIDQG